MNNNLIAALAKFKLTGKNDKARGEISSSLGIFVIVTHAIRGRGPQILVFPRMELKDKLSRHENPCMLQDLLMIFVQIILVVFLHTILNLLFSLKKYLCSQNQQNYPTNCVV